MSKALTKQKSDPSVVRRGNDVRTTVSNGAGNRNAEYAAQVGRSRRPSREELESALQSRTDSISARLSALQEEVSGTGASIKHAVTDNLWIGAGAALLGGLAVGAMLARRGDSTEKPPAGSNELADLVARAVKSAIDDGVDPVPKVDALLKGLQRRAETSEPPRPRPRRLTRTIGFALLDIVVRRAIREYARATGGETPDDAT